VDQDSRTARTTARERLARHILGARRENPCRTVVEHDDDEQVTP
jgi:hypothetical protein